VGYQRSLTRQLFLSLVVRLWLARVTSASLRWLCAGDLRGDQRSLTSATLIVAGRAPVAALVSSAVVRLGCALVTCAGDQRNLTSANDGI
jgi:hypothetical protein